MEIKITIIRTIRNKSSVHACIKPCCTWKLTFLAPQKQSGKRLNVTQQIVYTLSGNINMHLKVISAPNLSVPKCALNVISY